MSRISDVFAFEAFDSRGTPTVAVTVTSDDGCQGTALVPSGASVGSQEAVELRDGDAKRLQGRGVQNAVSAITEEIKPALKGRNVAQQFEIDRTLCELDGTDNKQRIGANAILGVSLANAHAAAMSNRVPLYKHINLLAQNPSMTLPIPQLNVLNGGAHANNNVDIQEFMVIPAGFSDFRTALRCAAEIFYELKKLLNERGLSTSVGDEGGFTPDLPSNDVALEFLLNAVDNAQWKSGQHVYLGFGLRCYGVLPRRVLHTEWTKQETESTTVDRRGESTSRKVSCNCVYRGWYSRNRLPELETTKCIGGRPDSASGR